MRFAFAVAAGELEFAAHPSADDAEKNFLAAERDPFFVEGIDRVHLRMIFQPRDHLIGDRGLESGDFIGRESDEEVRLDGTVDPSIHAGTEGVDHDGNTDGHGNGGHEGCGGEGVAVHGADEVAHGQPPGGATGEARREGGEHFSGRGGGGGDEEGKADDDEECGGETEQGRSGLQGQP